MAKLPGAALCTAWVLFFSFTTNEVMAAGRVEEFACFTDYDKELTCHWKVPAQTNCSKEFLLHYRKEFLSPPMNVCVPENGKDSLRCTCTIHPDYFVSGLMYILALQFNGTDTWNYSVRPALVVKPRAPKNLAVEKAENGNFNLSWEESYTYPSMLSGQPVIYEVKYWRKQHPAEVSVKTINYQAKSIEIVASSLKRGYDYIASVRCNYTNYPAYWSEWSEEVEFHSDYQVAAEDVLQLAVPMSCVLIMAVSVICYFCFAKVKKEWWDQIPDPAKSHLVVKNVKFSVLCYIDDIKLPFHELKRSHMENQISCKNCLDQSLSSQNFKGKGHPVRTNMRNKLWLQSISFFVLFQYITCFENLTCFVDYVQTLSCILSNDLGAGSYHLTATWFPEEDPENTVAACSLLQLPRNTSHTQYMCTVDMTVLLADIKVQVDVTEMVSKQRLISKSFYMAENIKPQPPFNLTAVFSEGYNISWETIYQNSHYYFLNEELEYQLRYKRRTDTWENQKTKAVHEDKRTLVILPWELQVNTEYEFQVRARPREGTGFLGFWSEWSPLLKLKTRPAAVTQASGVEWLLLFGGVVAITVSITTFLAKQRSLWKKMACIIPDPAHFFKPLYLVHNGDFKILSGMGGHVWQLGLQLCITAVLLFGGGRGGEFPGSLSCLNNYVTTVSCTWATEEPVGDGPFYLHFTNLWSKGHNASCKLNARGRMQNQYHCTIQLASQILEEDGYRVSLQGNFFGCNHTYVAFPEYSPREHIKLDPPLNIQSNITASKCQISWSVPWYLIEILQYELQFKESSMSWQVALNKTLTSSLPRVEIEASELRRGVAYIARVRCKVSENEDSYHSQWSEWSQTTVFQRAGELKLSEKILNTRTMQFLVIPLSFGTLLYLFWNCKLSSSHSIIFTMGILRTGLDLMRLVANSEEKRPATQTE
ncbi:interleukin-21 receptor isoform X5 [Apus apus]|uniref:interleukin-21 receptor isoform X5 n=1 Tax=Apus apus TaxID=8895 RepID=UPI0021F902AC|nr:interleukin-21 receptor isoform X5 [Apus apus]